MLNRNLCTIYSLGFYNLLPTDYSANDGMHKREADYKLFFFSLDIEMWFVKIRAHYAIVISSV